MICGMRCGNPAGNVYAKNIFAEIDDDHAAQRILTWTPEHVADVVHHVMIDCVEYANLTDLEVSNFPQDARDHIQVIETSTQNKDEDVTNVAETASDTAQLTWTEVVGADRYELYHSLTSGVYGSTALALVEAGEASYVYYDVGLLDDTHYYRLKAFDPAGNTINSNEVNVAISAAPNPPTNLSADVTAGTLSLTYTASTSADIDHYNVYRNDGAGKIELTAAAHAVDAASPWSEDMSAETGHYEYLLRAEDADANEEANLLEMVAVDLEAGVQVARPNSPEIIESRSRAIADGEVRIVATYNAVGEQGEATSIRLYVNNGAGGAIDYGTSVGSADLSTDAQVEVVSIDSTGLAGALTYRCVVRARTAAGVEDENTEYIELATDAAAPDAPVLAAAIV